MNIEEEHKFMKPFVNDIIKAIEAAEKFADEHGIMFSLEHESIDVSYIPKRVGYTKEEALKMVRTGEYVNLPSGRQHEISAVLSDYDEEEEGWVPSVPYY